MASAGVTRPACQAGSKAPRNAASRAMPTMSPSSSQGTLYIRPVLNCSKKSTAKMLLERIKPSTTPRILPMAPSRNDSKRKAPWISRRLQPRARSMPICWRRSITARVPVMASAVTPSSRVKPTTPSRTLLRKMRGPRICQMASSSTVLSQPLSRKAEPSAKANARLSCPGATLK